MKTFKKIDYNVQLVLIILGVFCGVSFGIEILEGPFIYMYFLVGGWQTMSVIVHLFATKVYKSKLRTIYHVLLILTIIAGIVSGFSEAIIGYLLILLFWSPLLAFLYLICSYVEMKKIFPETKASQHDESEASEPGAGM